MRLTKSWLKDFRIAMEAHTEELLKRTDDELRTLIMPGMRLEGGDRGELIARAIMLELQRRIPYL